METYKVYTLMECLLDHELKQLQMDVKAKPTDKSVQEDLKELLELQKVITTAKQQYLDRVLPY